MTGGEVVRFNLEPSDWHGYSFELLGCQKLQDGLFRISACPFFVVGMSKGDIIECSLEQGQAVFKRLVRKSGNSTFRFIFRRIRDEGTDLRKDELFQLLSALRPIAEISDDFRETFILYSVSTSPNNVREVYNQLVKFTDWDVIDYEEADFGGEAID
ncbi:DUF4265 domain-containing protein [Rhizobium sp. BK376]|uniref:DUF4265 domain-containing protein n=1 Tax=Rhizobium sp. BK376 TaxID=2512149 RepID=UPI00104EF026|nr:DUF4265 domain-containing protein [Rhizobium sp. BK376]